MKFMGAIGESVEQHSRRVKVVKVSGGALFELIKTSGPRVLSCHGAPVDARVLRIGYDPIQGCVLLFIEHESFPLCEEGCIPDTLHPMFTAWRRNDVG